MKQNKKSLHYISYLFRTICKVEPILLFMVGSCIITSVLMNLASVILPAMAVAIVEQDRQYIMMRGFIVLVLIYVVLSVYNAIVQNGRGLRQLYVGRTLLYEVFLKRFNLFYAQVESQTGQNDYEKARQVGLMGADIRLVIESIMNLSICVINIILYFMLMHHLSPLIIAFSFVLSVVSYMMTLRTQTANNKKRVDAAPERRKYDYLIQQCLSSKTGKDIRLYQMGSWIEKMIDHCLNKLQQTNVEYQKKVSQEQMVNSFIALMRDGVSYVYLITLAFQGKISVSELVLYLGAISQFINVLAPIIENYGTLQSALNGIGAVYEYLFETGEEIKMPTTDLDKGFNGINIEFQDVSFSYDGVTPILKHFNLKIESGEKIALVGINGAGKTTIVKLICGFYIPQEGKILINNRDITTLSTTERFSYLAVAFQESRILPYTVAENVSLCTVERTDMKRVVDCLKASGLYSDIMMYKDGLLTQMTKATEETGIILSGGQTQKLLMARLLYRQTAGLWILDEPTAALDPLAESEVYERFHTLCGKRTCVYISHRLASTRFLDRIIVLNQGAIVEEGTHDELLNKSGYYAELYHVQSQYYQEQTINEN